VTVWYYVFCDLKVFILSFANMQKYQFILKYEKKPCVWNRIENGIKNEIGSKTESKYLDFVLKIKKYLIINYYQKIFFEKHKLKKWKINN
jgi:hypothetical protein